MKAGVEPAARTESVAAADKLHLHRQPTVLRKCYRPCAPNIRDKSQTGMTITAPSRKQRPPSILARFLHASRYPPRIKCGAGFRLKTLPPGLRRVSASAPAFPAGRPRAEACPSAAG